MGNKPVATKPILDPNLLKSFNPEVIIELIIIQEAEEFKQFINDNTDQKNSQKLSPKLMESIKRMSISRLANLATNDRELTEIVPGLYLGSIAGLIFSSNLKNSGITHILSLIKNCVIQHVFHYYFRNGLISL